jgi:hypothetical protein
MVIIIYSGFISLTPKEPALENLARNGNYPDLRRNPELPTIFNVAIIIPII